MEFVKLSDEVLADPFFLIGTLKAIVSEDRDAILFKRPEQKVTEVRAAIAEFEAARKRRIKQFT